MTEFEREILNIIKSGITEYKTTLSEDFDWESLYNLALNHQIIPIVYYGIINSALTPPDSIKSRLEIATYSSLAASTKQMYELERIFKAFETEGIDFMPLKGTILKKLYPRPEMRQMGDADILIKVSQYDKIKPIMLDLGFEERIESDHELVWSKKGVLILELHKRLIPSYNKDYYDYFGDGWRLAKSTESSRYELSNEDNLIYMFTHYAKHYRDGGIGIRHLLDFKIYLDNNPDIDKEYIEKEFKKLQLFEFYKNSMKTLSVWFEDAQPNDVTDLITGRIFGSGSYGTHDKHIISAAVKKSKTKENTADIKKIKIFHLIFPPLKSGISQKYPILKKYPILLPFVWVVRWADAIFNNPKKITKQKEDLKLITDENISDYQKELNFVGLDFNFKE